MSLTVRVEVPPRDREVLASWVRSPSIRAGLAQRARIVLLAADGIGTNEIVRRTGAFKPTVIAWKKRYAAEGIGGLEDRPKPGKPRTTDDVAIVLATLEPPPARLGVTHWSSRLLASELGVSNVKVADVWREWGLQPWRAESFKFSTDPRLEAKVRDVVGLYLNPPGRLQIVYELLTSPDGIPVAIEVFTGNTGDPKTVASQVTKVKDRFALTRVVLVGDRGMLTAARLREDVRPEGLDWITALRAPQVKKLVRDGDLQLTLFDVQDLAEITSPDFPGERLVACKNPFLEAERARKRESLLAATEAGLATIAAACARARAPLRGQDKIAVRANRVLNRRKVAKHFTIAITDDSFSYARNQDSITAEAALDGIYVLRTSVEAGDLEPGQVVSSYKALAQVERAFRAFSTDLDIRPIRHRTEDRVRAHVFLRMLSYYITWHMQARLAPLLFTDDDKPAAQAARQSPVAPAARSPKALAKAATKHTPAAVPVHSFHSLLTDLATICLNTITPADPALPGFRLVTTPTAVQRHAFDLLGVSHRLGTA